MGFQEIFKVFVSGINFKETAKAYEPFEQFAF